MNKKIKKEQFLIGALIGVFLLVILIPVPKENEEGISVEVSEESEKVPEFDILEKQLKEILQKISGVGQVEVFITYKDNGKIVVEKDIAVSEEQIQEADSNGGTRTTTTNRNEQKTVYGYDENPFIIQQFLPEAEGILIVAEGAGNISIKNEIRQTIEALFGLDAHKISIMKMEVSK